MKKRIGLFSAVSASLLIVGCGGGTSTTTQDTSLNADIGTASYQDSAVEGVSYTCGSQSGMTGVNGEFSFEIGKGCTLNIGGVSLRTVGADELTDEGVLWELNIAKAMFLQTLDADNDPSNGITIDANTAAKIGTLNIDSIPSTIAELEDIRIELEAEGFTIVEEVSAEAHLIQSRLAGEKVYTSIEGHIYSFAFSNDFTSYAMKVDGNSEGVFGISGVDGSFISFENGGGFDILEITDTSVALDGFNMYFDVNDIPGFIPETVTPLAARSLPNTTTTDNDYFGYCEYPNGSKIPIIIRENDLVNDSSVEVVQYASTSDDVKTWHLTYPSELDTTSTFALDLNNTNGELTGRNNGEGVDSEITYEQYKINISGNLKMYNGLKTVWDGTESQANGDSYLSICEFEVGKGAKTEEDFVTLIDY